MVAGLYELAVFGRVARDVHLQPAQAPLAARAQVLGSPVRHPPVRPRALEPGLRRDHEDNDEDQRDRGDADHQHDGVVAGEAVDADALVQPRLAAIKGVQKADVLGGRVPKSRSRSTFSALMCMRESTTTSLPSLPL